MQNNELAPQSENHIQKVAASPASAGPTDHERLIDHIFGRPSAIAEVLLGMAQEVTEHPGKLASEALISAGVVAGLTRMAPPLALSLYGVGMVAGIYEGAQSLEKFCRKAHILDNSGAYSTQQVNSARLDLQSMGGAAADTLAVAVGGWGGMEGLRLVNAGRGLKSLGSAINSQKWPAAFLGGNYLAAEDILVPWLKSTHS